jgi:hypothetical protein
MMELDTSILFYYGSLTLNKWQHVTITYDRSNLRFYVNGIPKGVTAATWPIASKCYGSLYW